jgi:hypothetical protein
MTRVRDCGLPVPASTLRGPWPAGKPSLCRLAGQRCAGSSSRSRAHNESRPSAMSRERGRGDRRPPDCCSNCTSRTASRGRPARKYRFEDIDPRVRRHEVGTTRKSPQRIDSEAQEPASPTFESDRIAETDQAFPDDLGVRSQLGSRHHHESRRPHGPKVAGSNPPPLLNRRKSVAFSARGAVTNRRVTGFAVTWGPALAVLRGEGAATCGLQRLPNRGMRVLALQCVPLPGADRTSGRCPSYRRWRNLVWRLRRCAGRAQIRWRRDRVHPSEVQTAAAARSRSASTCDLGLRKLFLLVLRDYGGAALVTAVRLVAEAMDRASRSPDANAIVLATSSS